MPILQRTKMVLKKEQRQFWHNRMNVLNNQFSLIHVAYDKFLSILNKSEHCSLLDFTSAENNDAI